MADKKKPKAGYEHLSDPFGAYNELVKTRKINMWLNVMWGAIVFVALFFAFLAMTRPMPVVVFPENPMRDAYIVDPASPEDVKIRVIDAKRFFRKVAKLQYDWTSDTVARQYGDAFELMTPAFQVPFQARMAQEVTVDPGLSKKGKLNRLAAFQAQKMVSSMNLNWDSLKCIESKKKIGTWSCFGELSQRFTSMLVDDQGGSTFRWAIKASFDEVALTKRTVDGLRVSFWDETSLDLEEKK